MGPKVGITGTHTNTRERLDKHVTSREGPSQVPAERRCGSSSSFNNSQKNSVRDGLTGNDVPYHTDQLLLCRCQTHPAGTRAANDKITRGAGEVQGSEGVFVDSFTWTQALGEFQIETKWGGALERAAVGCVQMISQLQVGQQKQGSPCQMHHQHTV